MSVAGSHVVRAIRWGAIIVDPAGSEARTLGNVAPLTDIEPGVRRRTPKLELDAIRCGLGVFEPGAEIVLCSRYGNVETEVSLLSDIARAELMSPTAFSLSVHNAAAGLLGQIRGEKASHTAIVAGRETLAAGVLEAYTRIASGETQIATVLYFDRPLPELYTAFEDDDGPAISLALLVEGGPPAGQEASTDPITIQPGRRGAWDLMSQLEAGGRWISAASPGRLRRAS